MIRSRRLVAGLAIAFAIIAPAFALHAFKRSSETPEPPAPAIVAPVPAIVAPAPTQTSGHDEAARVEFFEKKVRPVFVANCRRCHSVNARISSGLRLDDRDGLLKGGHTGSAIVPGDPDKSHLLQRVTSNDIQRRMPAEGKPLTEEQVADLKKWIKDGAVWPATPAPVPNSKPNPEYAKRRKEHWAWQPLSNPKTPGVKNAAWPNDDIDRFVLAGLEANGLSPVADADRDNLLRRVTFDLTGLPPTPSEIDAFNKLAQVNRQAAFVEVVDRLLASPRFGERWGRHWLDVARYGESTGPSRNVPYPLAWKYRDYVIDSLNADLPFNRFIQEQIAGDLLPADSSEERDRLATATGFLALGAKDVNQRVRSRFVLDNVDEQIDTVTRSVLGLTVSCARCHDHKVDPIPTAEYYSLAGIFFSTDNCAGVRNKIAGVGLDFFDPAMLVKMTSGTPPAPAPADQVEKLKAEVAAAKKAWEAIRDTPRGMRLAADGLPSQLPYRLKLVQLQAELSLLIDPAARGYAVHGVRDAKFVGDLAMRIRGEAELPGPMVQRGFLTVLDVPDAKPINPKQSGRLELAQWLTSDKNPLAQRVIVNRVWSHLFGRGLVSTVDNFGVGGDKPSNPDLLDHLANRFIREGWSIKKLVRLLVLTRAYQLSSDATEKHRDIDPANVLVWRHSPRRLSAEEFRDATLAAAGALNLQRPGGSPVMELRMIELEDDGPVAKAILKAADRSRARSVYLPLLRGVTPNALEPFDPVEQSLVTGRRDSTTVPGQALFLLNSTFIRQQSLALAERLLKNGGGSNADRIREAYRLTLGRLPTEDEQTRDSTFLAEYETTAREEMAHAPSEPRSKPTIPVRPKLTEPTANPMAADASDEVIPSELVQPKDAQTAAWLALVQALYGSAEFRFVR